MATQEEDQILQRIAKYEEQGRNASNEQMQVDSPNAEVLEKQLDELIQHYETRLKVQKEELEQVSIQILITDSYLVLLSDKQIVVTKTNSTTVFNYYAVNKSSAKTEAAPHNQACI
jgi:hypothetical protein